MSNMNGEPIKKAMTWWTQSWRKRTHPPFSDFSSIAFPEWGRYLHPLCSKSWKNLSLYPLAMILLDSKSWQHLDQFHEMIVAFESLFELAKKQKITKRNSQQFA
jgi:hypothetical protein